MSKKIGKNDKAWNAIFNSPLNPLKEIKEKGAFYITADEIKKYGDREPRLITKIDHLIEAPKVFKKYKLSILPVRRGGYIIGPFKTHEELDYDEEDIDIHWMQLPPNIETIAPSNITSESTALNAAHLSGMIEDFVEEPVYLTVSGRMSSKKFEFYVGNLAENQTLISVENSQIEVDGGYEGHTKLILIEAKNKVPQDFLIRQLYYPFALWKSRVPEKKVIPIFFTYSDNVFSFFQYEFQEQNNYSSLVLVRKKHYSLMLKDNITNEEIMSYVKKYEGYDIEPEKVPFPQADNMLRVLDLLKQMAISINLPKEVVENGDEKAQESLPINPTTAEIAQFYGLASRQGSYYGDALAFLGFCEKIKGRYTLTDLGHYVQDLSINDRIRTILQQFFKSPVIRQAYISKVNNNGEIEQSYVANLIAENVAKIDSLSTQKRRARTIISWINWAESCHE